MGKIFAVILGFILIGIGWLAFTACGLVIPGLGSGIAWCEAPEFPPDPRLEALKDRERALNGDVAVLERRLSLTPDCPEPEPEPVTPPPDPEPAPPPQTPQPDTPQPDAPRPDTPSPQAPAEPEQARLKTPTEECPIIPSSEVMLVLDVSPSMNWAYEMPPSLMQRYLRLESKAQALSSNPIAGLLGGMGLQREIQQLALDMDRVGGPKRIELAKDALVNLVDSSEQDITFRYVTFSPCGPPRDRGSYGPGERPGLKRKIQGSNLEGDTALAQAIAALPGLSGATDPSEPVNVVLLSDGEDSCRGDPCAAASQVEQQAPGINIHVVALSRGIESLKCISANTKGQYFDVGDASALTESLRQASGQNLPAACR
ncbi:MAG: hypothetical protein K9H25_05840 [Rhodospirillum sp.]|nr:hypothetical protein [Rhodospirillum sp.]MCF8490233.1 hypothetical protein [Rhodospirillum sp.]MCF8500990.1 hypothetical protein [Rhodospirillum sp.]